MNVSAKVEYGLKALIHLACNADQGLVPAREIAGACGVPIKYLEQILGVLRQGGIVEAQVGSAGGYRLVRPARFITAGEAIGLLDERLGLEVTAPELGQPGKDPIDHLWRRIEVAIHSVVDGVSIEELAIAAGSASSRQRGAS